MRLFFFNDTATTEIYTLSLHDALPISSACAGRRARLDIGRDDDPRQRPPGAEAGERGGQPPREPRGLGRLRRRVPEHPRDRKSTRLNSSHANISYAVFCLKKKKNRPCTDRSTPGESSPRSSPRSPTAR